MSLKQTYQKVIVPALQKNFGLSNPHAVPTLEKIVVNTGVGKEKDNKEAIERISRELAGITGQFPSKRRAKKANASFSIREGDVIGLAVTLRGSKMWDFFEKIVNVALPRTRDFRGISRKSFDGLGNLTIGIKEHTVFPEVDVNKIDKVRSLEVTVVTTAGSDKQAEELLEKLGVPFERSARGG